MSGLVLATLENALKDWLQSKVPTGWTVTWADQNAPKPVAKQVVLKRGNIAKLGRDFNGKVNATTGKRARLGTREIMIEMRGYGPGSTQVLEDLIALLDDDVSDSAHVAAGFAVVESSEVRNLTALYSSQFKEVAQVETRLRAHSLRESTDAEAGVGYIRLVDLEVTTKSPGTPDVVETLSVVSLPG